MKQKEIRFRAATNSDADIVRGIVFPILYEYGLVPDPDGVDSDLDDIEASYVAGGGAFEILEVDEKPVGTVGLFPFDEGVVELRKMYLVAESRGTGLGKKLLFRAIERAKELGFEKLILETASPLKEAIGLYRSVGFTEVKDVHCNRCDLAFEMKL